MENVETYTKTIRKKVQSMMVHFYIANTQLEHLQKLKNELIFLGDLVENYGFMVQDEAHSFHWRSLQAMLHQSVIYYKENEKLKQFSNSIISDDMEHDSAMVHQVQNEVLRKVLAEFPEAKDVTYFSDSCASQYKNLCQHKSEFRINAK